MVNFLNILDTIIRILEDLGCWYRVVGGCAVDGYIGHITRSHNDIDIAILEEDLDRIEQSLNERGYSFSLLPFKLSFTIEDAKIELLRFHKNPEGYWFVAPKHSWPTDWLQGKEVLLEGVRIIVPSKEFLLSTRLRDRRREGKHDRQLLEQLGTNKTVAKRHRYP